MLSNLEKVKIVLSIIGDQSEKVLLHLKEEYLSDLYEIPMPEKPSSSELIKIIDDFVYEYNQVSDTQLETSQVKEEKLIKENNNTDETFMDDFLNNDEPVNEHEYIDSNNDSTESDNKLVVDKHDLLKPELIANCLKKESLQVTKFYFSMISEEEQENLLKYFSHDFHDKIINSDVKKNILSQSIFNDLNDKFYQYLFGEDDETQHKITFLKNTKKDEQPKKEESNESSSLFSDL